MLKGFVNRESSEVTRPRRFATPPNPTRYPAQNHVISMSQIDRTCCFTIFGCLIVLDILDWGAFQIPNKVRFGVGVPLVIFANIAVCSEVRKFGINQTGGAVSTLKTDGLYRYSRNPPYVADIMMIVGWLLLSASVNAILTGVWP